MWLDRARIESADVRDQQIPNHRVEESPDNVDRRRGEPLAGRLGKRTLKGASHRAGDKMRNGVCRKNAAKEVRHKPKPIHDAALLLSEQRNDFLCGPCLAKTRKDVSDAVLVRLFADIGHCIECEGHIESLLVGLPRRRLNANRCRHSSHNHLGNASRLELAFKIRCCECAPASLGDDNIARLLIQLRQKVGPSLGKRHVAARTLLRPARRPSRHIDQYDWKVLRTKNIDQRARPINDLADGRSEIPADDAFLQVNHDQRGIGIKNSKRHRSPQIQSSHG